MVAEPSGRSDHDVRACGQFALLAAWIHAADAGNHPRVGVLIQPFQFAVYLQRQLAGRCDDQGERGGGALEPLRASEQVIGNSQPIGDGFT